MCLLSICFTFQTPVSAQNVKVEGKLEVTDMPTENSDELLVTRKENGTLGTRQASSLMPSVDTIRTFERDLELAKQICECPTLPPFLVESALDNGYTPADLLGAGVTLQNLLDAGVDPFVLFQNGASPIDLVSLGYSEDLFIGQLYQGGHLFHIDVATNSGIVLHPTYVTGATFGCPGIDVPTTSVNIGTGASNTAELISTCGNGAQQSGIAATATNSVGPGLPIESEFSDWYIPSIFEVEKAINELVNGDPTAIERDFATIEFVIYDFMLPCTKHLK